ncbi:hypothetical protein O0L34_g8568 [Tuta absoluta]|nr:hypothetical protein O0L34_g8568 [Tuta absoluta]
MSSGSAVRCAVEAAAAGAGDSAPHAATALRYCTCSARRARTPLRRRMPAGQRRPAAAGSPSLICARAPGRPSERAPRQRPSQKTVHARARRGGLATATATRGGAGAGSADITLYQQATHLSASAPATTAAAAAAAAAAIYS